MLGGIAHLGRFIDKIRLRHAGNIRSKQGGRSLWGGRLCVFGLSGETTWPCWQAVFPSFVDRERDKQNVRDRRDSRR
ncbi:MAG: DUF5069 domain-containing protein [Nitrospiraceae bacterium]|nr:DUF5069 domain-containing protein [Nitrospiraceae bacterium]